MERILVIFIAFATLTPSYGTQDSGSYGLSESKSAQLRNIIDNQDKTLSSNFILTRSIFDVFEILSTTRKYNLQLEGDGILALINELGLTAKNSSDFIFNSISMMLEKACHPAEVAREDAYKDLKNVIAGFGSAFGLTMSATYEDIRTQFDILSVESRKSVEYYITKLFDTVRACIDTTDPETLKALKVREIESLTPLLRASDAIFDAIKVFAAGVPTEGDSVTVIPDMKTYRKRVKNGAQNVVEQIYSPIRGVYISTQLNRPEMAARMISGQYARIITDYRFKETVDIMFNVIRGFLTRVKLGLSDRCNDDSSAIDDAQAETAAYYRAGLTALAKSLLTSDYVVSPATAAKFESFGEFSDNATGVFFKAIKLAQGKGLTYSETLKQINTIEAALQDPIPDLIRKILNFIQLESNPQDGFTELQKNAIEAGQAYVNDIFVGIRVMAKVCHGIKAVSEDDFDMLQDTTNNLSNSVDRFNSHVSTGHMAGIKTLYQNPTAENGTQRLTVHLGDGFAFN